jgi:tripartite-type tricarboxylate transporter receptor subunit TctC
MADRSRTVQRRLPHPAAAAAMPLVLPCFASARSYPVRAIRVIAPFVRGGV